MKKLVYIFLVVSLLFSGLSVYGNINKREVEKVIERFTGSGTLVELRELESAKGSDKYEYQINNGRITISGSSGVAMCRGFYDLARSHGAGVCSWTGNRFDPTKIPLNSESKECESPFINRTYMNVVAFGYSTPYWDWQRWEREIDWMALHGINTPLALVGNEAIQARVWRKMGLSEKEIADYIVGPAYAPWMRMGNCFGIDSPVPQGWNAGQITLQHKILKRMRELGMTPICPGFAGFIPEGFKRLYPQAKIVETTWNGGAYRNWMISPDEELFFKMGKMFIEEWEKEFGKGEYYIIDSFNEMEIPLPAKGSMERYDLMTTYGDKVYQTIKAANPDATWVMQGWMFGYQRNVWDRETLAALLKKIPDDKMMIIDLAVDYNKMVWCHGSNWEYYDAFFGKKWVFSVIPNMGDRTGLAGILKYYANAHLEAVNSDKRGALVGFGAAPEGIENNEVVYELLCDAGWSRKEIEVEKWLEDYSACRYGSYNAEIKEMWDGLLGSVYGMMYGQTTFAWQKRPGTARSGGLSENLNFEKAVDAMARIAPSMKGEKLFVSDFIEVAVMYLGIKAELLGEAILNNFSEQNPQAANKLIPEFRDLLLKADNLLESHPNHRLDYWVGFARKHSRKSHIQDYYEINARRIISTWGPTLGDYSCRIWSGMVRDYYLPRWNQYFDQMNGQQVVGIDELESRWVEQTKGSSQITPYGDVVDCAVSFISAAKAFTAKDLKPKAGVVIGKWSKNDVSSQWSELVMPVNIDELRNCKGIRFRYTGGANKLMIKEVSIVMDGNTVQRIEQYGETGIANKNNYYTIDNLTAEGGNNSCKIVALVKSDGAAESNGVVELVKK